MRFENKVIVITGAANGIGAAASRAFGKEGAKIILSDIAVEPMEALKSELESEGVECLSVSCDVSDFTQVDSLIHDAVKHFGQIDILINNAGNGPKQMTKVADHTLDDWDRVVAVNQNGVFYGMKAVIPGMLKRGKGTIVNVASLAGIKASGYNIAYSASKFAVVGMTKSAALEYAKQNIRVNAVCPGYTETDLLDQLFEAMPGADEKLKQLIPMKRYGQVDEIVNAILFLASNESPFMTGHCLVLDGGTSL